MNTSKLWSALVLSCIACGSSFHSNDTAIGGDGSGGSDIGAGGTSRAGSAGSGGKGHGGSTSAGGSTSTGGVVGVGGDVSIAGSVSAGGVIGGGGDIGIAGGHTGGSVGVAGGPSGGAAGSNPSGGAGGSGSVDCSPNGNLWTIYTGLVEKASGCDLGSTGECVANSNIVSQGDCPIPVNQKSSSYDSAKKALRNWTDAGCKFNLTMCLAQPAPTCVPGSTAGLCKSSPIVQQ